MQSPRFLMLQFLFFKLPFLSLDSYFCSVFWESFFSVPCIRLPRMLHQKHQALSEVFLNLEPSFSPDSDSYRGSYFQKFLQTLGFAIWGLCWYNFHHCNSSEVHSNSERNILQLVLRLPPKTVTEVLFNLASGVHSKDFSLRFGAALGVFSTEEELLKAHHTLMFMYSSNSLEVHCAKKKWDGMMIDQGGHYIKHKDIHVFLNRYKKHLFCFCGGRWCTMFTCWACCSNCIDGIPVPSTLIAGWKICHLHSIYQEWWELFHDGKVWISLCCLSVWWRIMGFPEHMIQMMSLFNRWFQKNNMFRSTLDHWHSMSTSFFSAFS